MTDRKHMGGNALMSVEQPKPKKVLTFGETLSQDRLSKEDSPSVKDRPANVDSLSTLNMPKTLPRVAGHTPLPHIYTDHLCHWLSADEQAVYVQLYRLSWGWSKETCFISNRRLSERSGVPETSMRRAIRKLAAKRLIEKTNRVFGSQMEQGIEYRVFSLDSLSKSVSPSNMDRPSNMTPNKEKDLKESNLKGIDASKCPDCFGTGMYYPGGFEKGVAKCGHVRLAG